MHLIPDNWSHLHMLVGVFPSVGLIFAIGFYVASMVTRNEAMKRVCLIVFVGLGLLSLPVYMSGAGSEVQLAQDPKINQDIIWYHATWGYWGISFTVLTALISLYALSKTSRGQALSDNMSHLILGSSLVTLLCMVVLGEIGWEISHHELALSQSFNGNPATAIGGGAGTPQTWSHIHIILNHFPTVGFVFGLFFFIAGLATNNIVMKRGGLVVFVICAVLGAPTYVTGAAAMWAITDPPLPGVTKPLINAHRDWALLSLFGLAFTGVTAWIEIWRYRYLGRLSNTALYTVLVFAVITLGIMAETGHRGGQINHPEIREAGLVDAVAKIQYWSPDIETLINNVIWFVPWQTVHFFGYSLVFATVLALSLRIFGLWKGMPFSAIHRIIPLGVFGVVMNIFTGMLMLMADTFRYVNEMSFIPKMFFLPIGAIAVLYFSLSDKLWATKAGDEAPMLAKWVAALVLFSWAAVIMGGRLLPYI